MVLPLKCMVLPLKCMVLPLKCMVLPLKCMVLPLKCMVIPPLPYLYIKLFNTFKNTTPIPVAAQSKASVCGRLSAETVGSNPTEAWMSVCCECCVLSGRGLCDELITRPEESYQLWCVVVCDLETSWKRRPRPTGGAVVSKINKNIIRQFMIGSRRLMIREVKCLSADGLQSLRFSSVRQGIPGAVP